MTDINIRDERSLIKYQKRVERELTRLRIENHIAVTLRDMEKGIGELVERERQRNLTATYTNIIMENSADRFILLDEHLRLLLFSHNFETEGMLAADPGVELETILSLLSPDSTPEDVSEIRASLEEILNSGTALKYPMTIGDGDDTRYFDTISKGVNDIGSGRRGVVMTFTETTALTRAMQAAQTADKAKSAFLANMSHEIRTPINAIVGISEIALGRGGLSAEMSSDLSIIQNSAAGLLSIINDILDFSKLESGKFQIVPVEYALPSLLMDISNMICVKLTNSPVRLLMTTDASLPFTLYGDDIRVKQILVNLLNNATKFTKTGFIELRVDGEYLPDNRVKLTIKVIDSGIGIKKEDIGKLFGTFSQVDTQRNRAITGSGLGLSISRNLAETMGGGITVESEYGSGSTFTVTIIQEVRGTQVIGSVTHKEKVRMLVVEDDEILLDNIGRTLDNLGVEWKVCHSTDKLRNYEGYTHVLLLRKNLETYREKLEFMFPSDNIYLLLDQGEMASPDYLAYKQLQLPLLSLQIINALNGEDIVSSMKKAGFKRSQIVPLTYARVLVVDDNATNLQVAKGLMAPYKMQLDTASSGFKAIEMVRKTKYDAIFMDHMMPEMDGVEATQYIRNLDGEYYKKVPIIALTANAMSEARDMFLNSGMDDFISKPIEIVQLHRVIKKFIESKAPKGYLEPYKKAMEQQAASDAQKASASPAEGSAAPAAQGTPAVPAISFPAAVAGSAADSSLLSGLLQQNNLLLNQNSMLLQQILGVVTAQPSAAAVPPAASAVPQPEPVPADAEEEDEETDGDDGIPGVNMEAAIEGCGGMREVYDEILATYSEDLKAREKEVESLYAARDIKGFTIVVHALKSASRSIGAADLGEAAFSLEKHGKAEEWDAIEQEYPAFMTALREMAAQVEQYLSKHLPPKEEAPAEDKELLSGFRAETVQRLQAACADMDYMQAEDILHEMDGFCYPESETEVLASMLKACADFEYDRLEALAAELKSDSE